MTSPAQDRRQILICFRVQLPAIIAVQQLRIERNHSERLLKIMRDRIREFVERFIHPCQFRVRFLQFFGPFPDSGIQFLVGFAKGFFRVATTFRDTANEY